jgi:hypothetical protein
MKVVSAPGKLTTPAAMSLCTCRRLAKRLSVDRTRPATTAAAAMLVSARVIVLLAVEAVRSQRRQSSTSTAVNTLNLR